MDFSSFQAFVDSALMLLDNYGFIIVIIFGVLHPLIENPLSLFNMALAIGILGIPLGFTLVLASNLIGILLLWYFVRLTDEKSNNFLKRKKVSKRVLEWIKETETWKHIVVVGIPMIPTYPVKIAIPFSGITFNRYMITICGSYIFLYIGNSLIYFGVAGFVTNIIPNFVSFILLLFLVVLIYFGKYIFKKEKLKEKSESY